MSADTKQQRLDGSVDPEHLTTDPEVRIAPGLEVDATEGLWYCTECDLRITRNSHNHNEYGHARSCEHHQTFSGVER